MSVSQLIAEIEALAPDEREQVLDHLLQLREDDIPPAFRRSIADALAGRGTDMERVLREEPPKQRR